MILRFTFLCLSAILPLIAHADMVDTGGGPQGAAAGAGGV